MDNKRLSLLKLRLTGFTTTLRSVPHKDKVHLISRTIADNFNSILNDLLSLAPDVSSALPAPITASTLFAEAGHADCNYIDLEIFVAQTIAVIDHLESDN